MPRESSAWLLPQSLTIPNNLCWLAALAMIAMVMSRGYAAQPQWLRSVEEGRKAAQESKKDLLLVFTSHSNCAHCIILDREVFQQADFVEATKDRFVFVELDFSFRESVEDQQRKVQYEELAERFLITGYPTVILSDENLRPFAYFIGYEDSYGAERYLNRIRVACKDYQLFLDSSKNVASSPDGGALEAYAKALVNIAAHLDVNDDLDDPLLQFYSSDVDRILSELPEEYQEHQTIASRRKTLLLRAQRKTVWEPIANQLDSFYPEEKWTEAVEFIEETLPTLTDPYLQVRLEFQHVRSLRFSERYSEALDLSRRLQSRNDLDHEYRRRLANIESRLLLNLGKVDEAIARFDERIASAEQSGDRAHRSWLLFWKAQLMLSTDRLTETIAVCRASREAAEPGSDDRLTATYLLSLKLREAGEFEESLKLSRQQFEVDPQGWAMLDITESLIGLNRTGDALQWLDRVDNEVAKLRESARNADTDFAESVANRAAKLREILSTKN